MGFLCQHHNFSQAFIKDLNLEVDYRRVLGKHFETVEK